MIKRTLSEAASKMLLALIVLSATFVVAGIVFYRSMAVLPFILGVILIFGANSLRVLMLDKTTSDIVNMEGPAAQARVLIQFLLRYVIMGVVIMAAALTPYISLLGVTLGIISWTLAVLSLKFLMKIK